MRCAEKRSLKWQKTRAKRRGEEFEEKYENLPDGYNDRNGGVGWSSLVTEEQHEMVERAENVEKQRRT